MKLYQNLNKAIVFFNLTAQLLVAFAFLLGMGGFLLAHADILPAHHAALRCAFNSARTESAAD